MRTYKVFSCYTKPEKKKKVPTHESDVLVRKRRAGTTSKGGKSKTM